MKHHSNTRGTSNRRLQFAAAAALIFAGGWRSAGELHTRRDVRGAQHWVRATIDTDNPNLFSFEPRIVPANAR